MAGGAAPARRHRAADDKAFVVRIVKGDLPVLKHAANKVAIAQFVIGCTVHHIRMGGMESLGKHVSLSRLRDFVCP